MQTVFIEVFWEISPDGHWLAYQSNESGQFEIWVTPFPNVTRGSGRFRRAAARSPVGAEWELFYESMSALICVSPTSSSTFAAGPTSKLFDTSSFFVSGIPGRLYDIAPDGRRFLMTKASRAADAPPSARLVLVQHWFEELKQRAPTQ